MEKEALTLTAPEKKRLTVCTQTVDNGQAVFIEVGNALAEIRDGKLYRTSHKTFGAFCKEQWGIHDNESQ